MPLSWVDLIVIAIPVALIFGVTGMLRRYVRSAADYLAASRCAGRYVICTASQELGAGFGITLAYLEAFSRTGYSLAPWESFKTIMSLFLTLFAFVGFRYRQTRSLTFHQFLENRYSRKFRAFAATLNSVSGIINYGFTPGVIARFITYFCGFPPPAHLGLACADVCRRDGRVDQQQSLFRPQRRPDFHDGDRLP